MFRVFYKYVIIISLLGSNIICKFLSNLTGKLKFCCAELGAEPMAFPQDPPQLSKVINFAMFVHVIHWRSVHNIYIAPYVISSIHRQEFLHFLEQISILIKPYLPIFPSPKSFSTHYSVFFSYEFNYTGHLVSVESYKSYFWVAGVMSSRFIFAVAYIRISLLLRLNNILLYACNLLAFSSQHFVYPFVRHQHSLRLFLPLSCYE